MRLQPSLLHHAPKARGLILVSILTKSAPPLTVRGKMGHTQASGVAPWIIWIAVPTGRRLAPPLQAAVNRASGCKHIKYSDGILIPWSG